MKPISTSCARSSLKHYALKGAAALIMTLCAGKAQGQALSGNYMIPGAYPTLAAAIADLNTKGINGPVTMNVMAGYAETAPAGGFVLTATGNSTNTITFQKLGTGTNPILYAPSGGTATPASSQQDGVWSLNGSDYITIDGIDVKDTTNANPATMEYGYAFYKASDADGCQNNLIKNCNITLNRINNVAGTYPMTDGSAGILIMNTTRTAALTALTTSTVDGTNSNNKLYSNTIQNCNIGISLVGYAAPTGSLNLGDTGNDIGGTATSTGNAILNYGGPTTLTRAAIAVSTFGQQNLNVSYNLINNNNGQGFAHSTNLRGIYVQSATSANASITSNTITLTMSNSSAATMSPIENSSGTSTLSNTIAINNNVITNCAMPGATTPGTFYGIQNSGRPAYLNITGNTLSNNSLQAGSSGYFYGIYNGGSASVAQGINITGNTLDLGTCVTTLSTSISTGMTGIYNGSIAGGAALNISGNTFQNYLLDPATPSTCSITAKGYCIYAGPSATNASLTINSNNFVNLNVKSNTDFFLIWNASTTPYNNVSVNSNSVTSGFAKPFPGGTVYGYYNNQSPTTGVMNCTGNVFSNFTLTGATAFCGIFHTPGATSSHAATISGNTISSITTGSAAVTGIQCGGGYNTVSSNTVTGLSGDAAVYGINLNLKSNSMQLNNNRISQLSSTGAVAVYGIYHQAGGNSSVNKNKIFSLSGSNSGVTVAGYYQSGGTTQVANNLIADLTAPAANGASPVNGIFLAGTTSTTKLYYNTVYLTAASTGTLFGSSAVSTASDVVGVELRNNIFVNKSVASGAGFSVAHRRGAVALTSFSLSSNNNLYYAGTPGSSNLIFYDGTNSDQTLAAYKTLVSNAEQSSVTEDPAFTSTVTSNVGFLHFTSGTTSFAESGGSPLAGITDDVDGLSRFGNAGYAGTGTAPDIGAVEFEGASVSVGITSFSASPTATALCTASQRTISALITPGAAPISYVTLTYSVNGVAQPTLSMLGGTASAASTWTATIPVPSPSNAKIAWGIGASDGTIIKNATGTTYADEPLSDVSAIVSLSSPSVCAGSPVVLSMQGARPPQFIALGIQTTTTTASASTPFYSFYGGQKAQYIYTAVELSAAGLTAGNITSLAYDISTLGRTPLLEFAVSIGTTTQSVFPTATPIAGTNAVYFNASQALTAGINTFNLSTPFYWDGSSNLVLQICFSNNDSGSSQSEVKCSTYSDNNTMSFFADNTPASALCPATVTPSGSKVTNIRPNIIFGALPFVNFPTISWTDGTSIVATTNPATVTPMATSTYTVNLTDANGCSTTTVSPSLTVVPLPSALTATNSLQCGHGIPTASVSGAASMGDYRWYSAATGGTLLQSGGNTYTTAIASNTDFYVSQNNGCEGPRTVVSVSVTVVDPIQASIGSSTLCAGSTTSLSVSKTGNTNNFTYTWTASPANGAGLPAAVSSASLNIQPTLPGTYVYTVTGVDGLCANSTTVSASVLRIPFTPTITSSAAMICVGDSVKLDALAGMSFNFGTQANQNGASATASGYPAPYSAYYGGQRMQMLILASELQAAGFNAGSQFNSLQFPVVSRGSNWGGSITELKDFQINIGSTTTTSISAFQSGLSNVVPVGNFTPTVGYNNTHTFSTPYAWDGTSNIIIETTFSNNVFGTTNDLVTQYNSPTAFPSCVVYRSDDVTASVMASTSTLSYSYSARPDFRLNDIPVLSWSPAAGLSSTTKTSVKASPASATTYVLSSAYGVCTATSNSVTITVSALPNVSASTSNTVLCAGESATLSASGATSYTWMPGSLTVPVTTVNPGNATTYTVTGADVNNCRNTATVSINVNALPTLTLSAMPSTICLGGNTTLGVLGANTYTWNPAVITGNTGTVSPVGTTTYSVSGTNTNNCVNTNTITITVNALPTITATASSSVLCAGSSATLTANGATSYTWTPGSLTGSSILASPGSTSTYTVLGVDANNCRNSSTINLTVNPAPTLTATAASSTLCAGSSVILNASGAGSYTWMPGSAGGASVTVNPGSSTNYTVTGTDANGCQGDAVVSLTVNPSPTVTATAASNTICAGSSVVLTASGASTYVWLPGAAVGTTLSVSPGATTTYTLSGLQLPNTCPGSASVTITVDPCTGIEDLTGNTAIQLYPNPSNGNIVLSVDQISGKGNTTLNIFDMNGRIVYTRNILQTETLLNLSELASGLYYAELVIDRTPVHRRKLVME